MYRSKYSSFLRCHVVALYVVSILTRAFSLLAVFHTARIFNSDVSKWNVANVSTMHDSKYSSLPLRLSIALHHIVSTLTRAFSLFAGFAAASVFNSDVSKWNVAKVSTMHQSKYSSFPCCLVVAFCPIIFILTRACCLLAVFSHADEFNSDVSKWNVAKVSTMHGSKCFRSSAVSSSSCASLFPS